MSLLNNYGVGINFPVPSKTPTPAVIPDVSGLSQGLPHQATIVGAGELRPKLAASIPVIDSSKPGSPVVGNVTVNTPYMQPTSMGVQSFDSFPQTPQVPITVPVSVQQGAPVQVSANANLQALFAKFNTAPQGVPEAVPGPAYKKIVAEFTVRESLADMANTVTLSKEYDDVVESENALIFIVKDDPSVELWLPPTEFGPGQVVVTLEDPRIAYFGVTLPVGQFNFEGYRFGVMLVLQKTILS